MGGPGGTLADIVGFAFVLGYIGLLVGGWAAMNADDGLKQAPVFADLRHSRQRSRLARFLLWGGLAGLPFGLVMGLVMTLAGELWNSVAGYIPSRLSAGLTANLESMLILGTVAGLVSGFVLWAEIPPPEGTASTPTRSGPR